MFYFFIFQDWTVLEVAEENKKWLNFANFKYPKELISMILISVIFALNSRNTPEREKYCFITVDTCWHHGHCE